MSDKKELIAINIALMPDTESFKKCLVLSDALQVGKGKGLLGPSAVPHLTLWMGLVPVDEVSILLEWVNTIDLKVLLHKPEVVHRTSGQEDLPLVHVVFEKNDLIQQLHEAAHRRADGHRFLTNADTTMFKGEEISASTLAYAVSFHDDHSMSDYEPHITIGYGISDFFVGEEAFAVDRVAIFQMGNACTCAEELKLENSKLD